MTKTTDHRIRFMLEKASYRNGRKPDLVAQFLWVFGPSIICSWGILIGLFAGLWFCGRLDPHTTVLVRVAFLLCTVFLLIWAIARVHHRHHQHIVIDDIQLLISLYNASTHARAKEEYLDKVHTSIRRLNSRYYYEMPAFWVYDAR